MNELIEYFKKIEARLAALETAQQAKAKDNNEAIQQELEALSEQVSALLTSFTSLQEQLATYQEAQAELESRMDSLESREEPEDEEPMLPIAEQEEEDEEPEPAPEPEMPHSVVPKVTDIKKAISLGDRFLFQRELFGGNGELMAKTIVELNKLDSLDEAEDYIAKHFIWDKESSTYELFYNILKRRW